MTALLKSLLTLTLATSFIACGKQHTFNQEELNINNNFIVGGTKVAPQMFQSVVGITSKDGHLFCTGNLIANNKIATASHCIMSTQTDELSAKYFMMSIQRRVNDKLNEYADNEGLNREQLKEKIKDHEFVRPLLKNSIREYMQDKTLSLGIYLGNGKKGEEVVQAKHNIIQSIKIPEGYINYLFSHYFAKSPYYHKEVDTVINGVNPDQAIITLKKPLQNVEPVPFATEEETRDLLISGESRVTLVGFGSKVDMRAINNYKKVLQILNQTLKERKDELTAAEKKQLEKNIAGLLKEMLRVGKLLRSNGDKNVTDVKVVEYLDYMVVSNQQYAKTPSASQKVESQESEKEVPQLNPQASLKEKVLHYALNFDMDFSKVESFTGACFGDSGGPAFAKKADGTLVQVGVMVSVNYCGKETYITPILIKD